MAKWLRILSAIFFLIAVLLWVLLLTQEAEADYRPRFVERSLNRTYTVQRGRVVDVVPGGAGTHYIFKETRREYYRGPASGSESDRRTVRGWHHQRRPHHDHPRGR